MKFRQFEFSFFPRIRSKKKKKSKYSNTSLDKNFPLDKNFNYSKISYDNAAVDKATASTVDSGNDVYEHGFRYMRSNSDYSEYQEQCCFYSQTYPLPKLTIDIDNPCSCEICASSLVSSAEGPLFCATPGQTPLGTPLSTRNTIPRTRTRIKTNPWLPSPRTTPSLTPTETVESVIYSSSECPRRNELDLPLGIREPSFLDNLTDLNRLENEATNLSKVTEEDIDEVKTNTETLDDIPSLKTRKRFSYRDFLLYDTDSSKCASPVVEQIEIVGNISCKICFKYEDNVDDLLENQDVIPRDATFLSIKDLLEDDYNINGSYQNLTAEGITQTYDSKEVKTVEMGSNSVLNKSMDQSVSSEGEVSDVISNMDLTFYDEGYMLESIDTGYGSGTRDSDSDEEFEPPQAAMEPSFEETELEWDHEPSAQNLQGLQSYKQRTYSVSDASDIGGCRNCGTRPRSRSLADIEASLDEKVSLLREEKYFVQRKIKEAREEEEIRRGQVQLFRSYSVDNRKKVLLQTLNDLKTRLANQSTRLQSSYDTVLSIQRTFSQRKTKLPVLETMI